MGIENVAEKDLTRSSSVAVSKGWSGSDELHLMAAWGSNGPCYC